MESLIENNRLILDFMGVKPIKLNEKSFTWADSPFFSCHHDTEDKVFTSLANYAKYHSDWNWLMEVVEKIESFEDENRCAKYNFITEQSFVQVIDNSTSDEIVSLDAETKIQAIYNAVVQFIKWHNLNNK